VSFPCITPKTLNVKSFGKIDRIFAMHAYFVSYLLSYSVVADAAIGENEVYYLNILENME
jgi:hypothetical protein